MNKIALERIADELIDILGNTSTLGIEKDNLEYLPNWKNHTKETPRRFADYWRHLNRYLDTEYREEELAKCKRGVQPTKNDQMIVCGPVSFFSICPHHLSLVMGKAYVGYVPKDYCIGLSKLPRIVRLLAARPIIQEDLTHDIECYLRKVLGINLWNLKGSVGSNSGIMVVLECVHTCMITRGVQVNTDCTVTTSAISGCFKEEGKGARQEFLTFVQTKREKIL